MKKFLMTILSVTILFALTACGTNTSTEEKNVQEMNVPENKTEANSLEATGKTLVAYFSWSGNTAQMAAMIQEETGADLFEITPASAYTDDYDVLLDQAQQEQKDNARPAIAEQIENWEDYNVVFVGYPDWWNDAPMIIYTFLESYDWSGKTLIPFCTSGGSGFGRSLDAIEACASGAAMGEGLHLLGDDVSSGQEEVSQWIAGLGLAQ